MADTYARVMADGVIRWQFSRADLILEYKDTKPPLPPPLNVICFSYGLLLGAMGKCWNVATGSKSTPTSGFKTVVSAMQLRIYERREQVALREALRQRSKKQEGTAEWRDERVVSL